MKTLEEHNNERYDKGIWSPGPKPNGIACPKCGLELLDTNPGVLLTSYPPQLAIYCECGWKGFRLG